MSERSAQPAPATPAPRVVINGRFLGQVTTGVQRYALQTLKALDALLVERGAHRAACRFELAVPEGAEAPALEAIRAVHLPGRAGHVWEQWALLRHARGAYLVNFNYSGPLLKRAQMVTIHDATVAAHPQAFKPSYRLVHHTLVAVLGRSARDVMTVSEFSRYELRRWFGLVRDDILVGREGGAHAVLPADDAAVLRRHGLQSGRYLLGVGSVKPNKNFGLIGQAMRLVPRLAMPVAVVGARDIGIFADDTVPDAAFRFLGFVADDELSALYRNAAWFVFPSLYEGFGLPAVEAMAHDCPVLAARAASIPEICGDAALYFDPHDAASLAACLERAVAEPELRESLVAAGRARLARYTWRSNAALLLDRIEQRLCPAPTLDATRLPSGRGGAGAAAGRESTT